MKPADRLFLLFLILAAWVLTIVIAGAAFVWPHGLLDVNAELAAMSVVALITLVGALTIAHGKLVMDNQAISPAERAFWMVSFVIAGPAAFPCYWLMHIWTQPYTPSPAT